MYTIYSKPACSSCDQAKQLLEIKKQSYEYKVLGKDFDLEEFSSHSKTHRTFPLILKDGVYLGGLPDLKKDLL